jgi:hypothetical protein
MPRGKKTQSGAPAQKVESVTGQRYGEGQAQTQMQEAMPAPNAQSATQSTMAPSNAPAPQRLQQPASAVPQQPVDVGQFLQGLPKNLLGQPDQRPVTSGLPFGPGNNTMAQMRTPATNIHSSQLDKWYQMTGNPRYLRLKRRISR